MPPFTHLPLDLLTVFVLVLLWTGVGLRCLGNTFQDEGLRRLAACGLGLFCFMYGVALITILGFLTFPILLSLMALFLIIGYHPLANSLKRINWGVIRTGFQNLSPFEQTLLWILIVSAATHLLFGYAPPTADDEMVYQISLPRLYATFGKLVPTPDNVASFYPLNVLVLFSAMLVLRGVLAVKVLVWTLGLLVSAAFVYFTSTYLRLNRRFILIALTLFYTMPYMTSVQGTCSSDLFSLFFGLLATLLLWEHKKETTIIILMGIFGGAGMGSRYYAAAWVISIALVLVIFHKKYKDALLFLIVTGVVFSPWPLRSFLLTGNPVYPKALPGLPQNPYFTAVTMSYALTPLWVTICLTFLQIPYGKVIWGMGFLPASVAPFSLFGEKERATIRQLLFLTVSTMAFTFVFPFRVDRYFGQGFVYIALLGGAGWYYLWDIVGDNARVWLNRWLMIALVVPNLFLSLFFAAHRLPYFLGLQSEADYLTQRYTVAEGYPVIHYIHDHVPKSSRIVFLGPQQGYYFYYPDWTFVDMIHFPPSFYNQSTARLAAGLVQDGIRYVIFERDCFTPNADGSWNWWALKSKLDVNIPPLNLPYFRECFQTSAAIVYEVSSLPDLKNELKVAITPHRRYSK